MTYRMYRKTSFTTFINLCNIVFSSSCVISYNKKFPKYIWNPKENEKSWKYVKDISRIYINQCFEKLIILKLICEIPLKSIFLFHLGRWSTEIKNSCCWFHSSWTRKAVFPWLQPIQTRHKLNSFLLTANIAKGSKRKTATTNTVCTIRQYLQVTLFFISTEFIDLTE